MYQSRKLTRRLFRGFRVSGLHQDSLGNGLFYKKYGHIHISYAGKKDDRKFITRYLVFVGANLVTLRSEKQDIVSRSSFRRVSSYGILYVNYCGEKYID